MAKAMLIMDMPSCCDKCELKVLPNPWAFMICGKTKKHIDTSSERPKWCPLREVQQKKTKTIEMPLMEMCEIDGYNSCIDEILGGGE